MRATNRPHGVPGGKPPLLLTSPSKPAPTRRRKAPEHNGRLRWRSSPLRRSSPPRRGSTSKASSVFFFVGRAACRAEARTDFHCSALHFFFSLPSLGLLSLPFLRCANSPLSNTAFARHESRIVRLFPLPRAPSHQRDEAQKSRSEERRNNLDHLRSSVHQKKRSPFPLLPSLLHLSPHRSDYLFKVRGSPARSEWDGRGALERSLGGARVFSQAFPSFHRSMPPLKTKQTNKKQTNSSCSSATRASASRACCSASPTTPTLSRTSQRSAWTL